MRKFVTRRFTTPLYRNASRDADQILLELLWGDSVRVLSTDGALARVRARDKEGFVQLSHLGDKSLLELYFIDVGQGDGVLIRTPDDRHILIDGGWPRKNQPTGKNAADFVDWKFVRDYGVQTIRIDAMLCSHNDQDHYGGLWDLLDVQQNNELDATDVRVNAFFHAGLSWWNLNGKRTLGEARKTPSGWMWTRLLEDRQSLEDGLRAGANPSLQGEWRSFLARVRDARTADGNPTPVQRLSHATGVLPGFENAGGVRIAVLGPVEFEVDGGPAIRQFTKDESQNTNGNSVLLRLDYGRARILLTGDLNQRSQKSLLDDYAGEEREFACDVVKACHHGSGDISLAFLQAVNAACTIISSGDTEGHDHPRPEIVAASGLTGFKEVRDDKLITPLVYSTELARSVAIGKVSKLERLTADGQVSESFDADAMRSFRTQYSVVMAGARSAKSGSARIGGKRLAANTTYGLLNVRTDGRTIMCAALNEKDKVWNVASFAARFG